MSTTNLTPAGWLASVQAQQTEAPDGVTPWFSGTVAPARPGYYDRCYTDGTHRHYWDGKLWRSHGIGMPHWHQVGAYPCWRGSAKPPLPPYVNLPFVNKVAPEHDRMSCNDYAPINSRFAPGDMGGCYRCTLLEASLKS